LAAGTLDAPKDDDTVIELDTLMEYSAPAFAEVELLEEWYEALCAEDELDRPARLMAIAAAFEDYITQSSVQADLAKERTRSAARRRTREELASRVEAQGEGAQQSA
jgi:hypothetical protein